MSFEMRRVRSLHGPVGRCQAKRAARRHQHQSFGNELANQASARRTQRAPYRNLTLTARGTNEQKARYVDACNHQQQPSAPQQHEQDRPDIRNDHFRQRQHTGALVTIVFGILQFQLPRNRLHLGAGHLRRNAILEPSDSVEVVAAAAEPALIGSVQRSPELYISSESELETLRQHSDDGIGNAAEGDGFAGDIFSSAKPFLPRGVAQDHGSGSTRQILASIEIAPENRSNPQNMKKTIAHAEPGHRFCSGGRAQKVAASRVDLQRTEYMVELLPIEIVGIRKVGMRNHGGTLRHVHQPVGIQVRQRLDQRSIDKAKNCHAGADPQSEDQNGRAGKPRALAQLPECIAKILDQPVHLSSYSYLSADMGSTLVARRAGT